MARKLLSSILFGKIKLSHIMICFVAVYGQYRTSSQGLAAHFFARVVCARSGSSAGVADRRPLGARLHVEGTWREIAIDGAQHIATASSLSSLRDAGVRLAASRRNGENLEHGLGLATGARLDRAEGRLGVVPRSMRRSDTRSGLYHLPGPRGHTVYECPGCGERYLGQQRCEACGIFCSRIGAGGACPHCAEPVAIQDITDTTQ